jgi:hypothetical protein
MLKIYDTTGGTVSEEREDTLENTTIEMLGTAKK